MRDRMSGHKTNFNIFRTEIISSTFSNHNGMKLQIQEENWKKNHKYVEIKQYTTEQQ